MEDYALDRKRLSKMSLPSFEQGYENKRVKIGEDAKGTPKYMPAGRWWRYHDARRQYETIVFAPERQVPKGVYNLWQGFAVESRPGDCGLFLEHLREHVCAGNKNHYEYLLGWMARAVQYPASPGEVAIVLRGARGVGKGFFAKVFGGLFGQHFMQVSNSSHLVGNFNAHMRDLVVLFADEAFYANDKKHESILKTLVTEETMAVEAKGIDIETGPNYIHLIMASNDLHVIPAGGDERRFFVLDVTTQRQRDTAYFRAIREQLDSGGREALLHLLRHRDLEGYEVRDVPTTEALREQKLLSMDVDEEWWFQKLQRGALLYTTDEWPREVVARDLVADYVEHGRRHHLSKRSSETKLGRFLHKVLPRYQVSRRNTQIEVMVEEGWTRSKTVRAIFYQLPTLEECRKHWTVLHGPADWPEEDTQEQLGPPF